MMMVMMIDLIR